MSLKSLHSSLDKMARNHDANNDRTVRCIRRHPLQSCHGPRLVVCLDFAEKEPKHFRDPYHRGLRSNRVYNRLKFKKQT